MRNAGKLYYEKFINSNFLINHFRDDKMTKLIRLSLTFIIILPFLFSITPVKVLASDFQRSPINFREILDNINFGRVWQHMSILSSFDSRVTGYSGCEAAAEYIESIFRSLNLTVITQSYNVTVPVDHGATLTILSPVNKVFSAYTLWPNYVQSSPTPPEGLMGKLVDVRDGELSDFDGKEIAGNIVMMNFNSGNNWIRAANFGAKAVIFVEPEMTTRVEAESKFVRIPLYLPRIYISRDVGAYLRSLGENIIVNIKTNMRYETTKAKNIIGIATGSIANENIIVAAHYDTWSIIPSLAPGADETAGISLLLELARLFSENKPTRNVWFVALSGHWQALAGAREFVEEYYFKDEVLGGKRKIWMFIGLDFSSDSDVIGVLWRGYMYNYGSIAVLSKFSWIEKEIFQVILPALEEQFNISFKKIVENGFNWPWTAGSLPDQAYMLDSEPACITRGIAFTLRTTRNAYRLTWGHPFSNMGTVKKENLKPQMLTAAGIIYHFVNVPTINIKWEDVSPYRVYMPYTGAALAGFVTIQGKVLEYDIITGWYKYVPKSLVIATSKPGSIYPFADMITYADENGTFIFKGCGMGYAISGWSLELSMRLTTEVSIPGVGYYITAFVFNSTTGQIIYAPNLGQFGAQTISFWSNADRHPCPANTVVFRSSSAVIFDLIDPERLSKMAIWDARVPDKTFVWSLMNLRLLNFKDLGEYLFQCTMISRKDGIIMIFLPPESRFIVLLDAGYKRSIQLINASAECPEGAGYFLKSGEQLSFTYTIKHLVRDFIYVSAKRYETLNASFIRSPLGDLSFKKTWEYYNNAVEAFSQKRFSAAYQNMISAWLWAILFYSETMRLINDVSYMLSFFFIISVAFIFLFERLVFSATGRKRLLALIVLMTIMILALYLVNPSLRLASSPLVGILGIILLFFLGFVLFTVISEVQNIMYYLRGTFIGRHFMEAKKIATFSLMLDVAVRNMRKRRTRSFLVSITILAITFGMASLSSASLLVSVSGGEKPQKGAYNGLFIKRGDIRPSNYLGDMIPIYVMGIVPSDGIVSVRAWYYPATDKGMVSADIIGRNGSFSVLAALGLSAGEAKINPTINYSIIEGRWFNEWDYEACMLSQKISALLNVKVNDVVEWCGAHLRVVGIYDEKILDANHTDLDGRLITPLDPNNIADLCMASVPYESFTPLSWGSIIVVPYRLAISLWKANIASISVKIENPQVISRLANEIAMTLDVEVYSSFNGQVKSYSRLLRGTWQGLAIIFPLIIGAGTILNTMLGLVQERKKEIEIVSSLGLSPRGIMELFFSEALVYAIVGALFGYLAGVGIQSLLIKTNILPTDFTLNYSSLFVALTIFVAIFVTLLSTIIPSYKASAIVTPSLERRWKISTKPINGEWSITLPLTLEDKETKSIILFLSEFFKAYTVEGPNFVVREINVNPQDLAIHLTVALKPYDAGVTQEATFFIQATRERERVKYHTFLRLKHLTGPRTVWINSNYSFIDAVRKQLLIWRSLKEDEKARYK
jgi:ABC-type antimicrobial peptide transport system permease subunit